MAKLVRREVLRTTISAILVILTTHPTGAINWLGLHSMEMSQWNHSLACRQVRVALQLTPMQTRMCHSSPEAMAQVARAASTAVEVCQQLLQDRRWNCSSIRLAPHFTPDLLTGTREQSFVYALSSAALMHSLARACAAGQLPQCSCASLPQEPTNNKFQWGGCGDNLRWAAQFTRQFVDSADRRTHRRNNWYQQRMRLEERLVLASVNLHNNKAGRRAVNAVVRLQCKCHGVSGSCSLRTCWRALPQRLTDVGAQLLRHLSEAMLQDNFQHHLAINNLLYITPSSDYCHKDYRVGSVGTYGRRCNASGQGSGSCASMCCGRGYVTQTVERVERCHCKYYWCCYVKCKVCRTWVNIHLCN